MEIECVFCGGKGWSAFVWMDQDWLKCLTCPAVARDNRFVEPEYEPAYTEE